MGSNGANGIASNGTNDEGGALEPHNLGDEEAIDGNDDDMEMGDGNEDDEDDEEGEEDDDDAEEDEESRDDVDLPGSTEADHTIAELAERPSEMTTPQTAEVSVEGLPQHHDLPPEHLHVSLDALGEEDSTMNSDEANLALSNPMLPDTMHNVGDTNALSAFKDASIPEYVDSTQVSESIPLSNEQPLLKAQHVEDAFTEGLIVAPLVDSSLPAQEASSTKAFGAHASLDQASEQQALATELSTGTIDPAAALPHPLGIAPTSECRS